jgi:putative flippase GtrA
MVERVHRAVTPSETREDLQVPTDARGIARLLDTVRDGVHLVVRELVKFGAVGAVAYVVDVSLFNLLRYGGGASPLEDKPLTAKIISAFVATVVAWLGNRYWTFRHRRRASRSREFALFVVMNAIGMGIAVACLGLSHYVLGLRSALADNISANVVGIVLGSAFRFWAYRRHVFAHSHLLHGAGEPGGEAEADALQSEFGPVR